MTKKNKDFIIVPDPNAINASFEYVNDTYTTINGKTSSALTPSANNIGAVSGFSYGTSNQTTEYNLRIQESGGLYNSNYAWKKSSEADSNYRGESEPSSYNVICQPFFPYGGNDNQGRPTGIWSKKNKKEYLIVPRKWFSSYLLSVYTRDSSDDESTFEVKFSYNHLNRPFSLDSTINSIDFQTAGSEIRNAQVDICELSNGDMRLAVVNNNDIDIYHTTDCVTFTLIAEKIVERFIGLTSRPLSMVIASSGDYLRIAFAQSNNSIRTLLSRDRGASWEETSNEEITDAVSQDPAFADPFVADGDNRYHLQLIGTNPSTGEFLLVSNYHFYYAVASNQFQKFEYKYYGGEYWTGGYSPGPQLGQFQQVMSEAPIHFNLFNLGGNCFIGNGKDYIYIVSESRRPWPRQTRYYDWNYNDSTIFPQRSIERKILLIDKQYPLSNPRIIDGAGDLYANEEPYNMLTSTGGPSSGYRGCKKDMAAKGKIYETGSGIAFVYQNYEYFQNQPGGGVSGGSYLNNATRILYERYANWQTCPKKTHIRYRSSLTGEPSQTGYPLAVYKNIPTGQWWWHQWDVSCGVPDPFVPSGPFSLLPSDDYISGGAYTNANGQSAYSLWQEFSSGNATYFDPDLYGYQGFVVRHPKNSQGMIHWTANDPDVSIQHPDYLNGTHDSTALSPKRCWGYYFTGNLMNDEGPHGVLAEWCMQTSSYNYFTAGVRIHTWASQTLLGNITNYRTSFYVYCLNATPSGGSAGKVQVVIRYYDGASFQTAATFEIDTDDALPLFNHYHIFRLSCSPTKNATTNTWNLSIKRTGTNDWNHFSFVAPNNNYSAEQDQQKIVWGCINENTSTSDIYSSWLYVRVSEGNPYNSPSYAGQFADRTFPSIVRGRLLTGNGVQIEDGQYVSWAGTGAMNADSYTLGPEYVYSPINAFKFQSPQTEFRITNEDNSNNSEIVFRSQTASGSTYCSFNHNSWAVFNTNANRIKIEYAGTTTGSWTHAGDIYMQRAKGRITAAESDTIQVDWDTNTADDYYRIIKPNSLSSTEGKDNYIYWETPQAGSQFASDPKFPKYKIKKHIGLNTLVLSSDRDAYKGSLNANNVGTTVMMYSSSGCAVGTTNNIGPYVRFTAYGSNIAPEGYLKIGTLAAGTCLTLDVELDWSYQNDFTPNLKQYSASNGINWAYQNGPTKRQFSGEITGDISEQQRKQIRNQIDANIGISQYPFVLSINNDVYPDHDDILWGTFDGTYQEKNDGWYYDTDQERWLPIGNLSITVTEST